MHMFDTFAGLEIHVRPLVFSPQSHGGTKLHGDFFMMEAQRALSQVYWVKRHKGYNGTTE